MKRNILNHGYVAISTVIVVVAVLLIILTTTSLVAISEGQMSLSGKKADESSNLVEGCVEDALIRINKSNNLPTSLILPEGQCTVTIDSHVGNDWKFTISGSVDNYTKKVQVQASRGSVITITNWKEPT